jgi:cytidyltransferase-like protein
LTLRLVGVYGGTFNPIHVGHLRAAEEIAEAFGLARVLFVPSAVPPHKADAASDGIAPAACGSSSARSKSLLRTDRSTSIRNWTSFR